MQSKALLWPLGSLAIFLGILYYIYDPSEVAIFPSCPFHSLTGMYCPGCGSQRALHSLLHLDIQKTLSYNLLFIPMGLVVIYNTGIELYNTRANNKMKNLVYTTWFPLVILAIVILFWIFRNLPYEPFTHLAPPSS